MASQPLSSPSQQLLSFSQAPARRSTTPGLKADPHSQEIHHTSPYALRQRSVSAAASWRGENNKAERHRDELVETVEQDEDGEWRTENATFGGRRELESDSSDYEPSSTSSSSSSSSPSPPSPKVDIPEARKEDGQSVKAGVDTDEDESDSREDDSSSAEDDGISAAGYRAGLKRPHQGTISTASAEVEASPQHGRRKRLRRSINMAYMGLLHDDEDDAHRQYIPDVWPELETSQAGLSIWTAEEKEMLYEALSRLGRDDIPGIAARLLGSKSELEVRDYLHLLHADAERRRSELRAPLHRPLLSDFPAAAEISKACCDALEETADAIARREDNQAARDEGRKWGSHWLLTGNNCDDLSKAALAVAGMPTDDEASNQSPMPSGNSGTRSERVAEIGAQLRPNAVPPLALFQVRNMLLLSERVFMNGVDEDAHYLGLGDALPAAHMSALHDMYELVYALTQRVAVTAMHVCQFRYQSDRRLASKTKRLVRSRDVQAAVASLGLKPNSLNFWARCPRRLGLNVSKSALPFADMEGASRLEIVSEPVREAGVSEGEDSDGDNDSEEEDKEDKEGEEDDSDDDIMTYDEVEQELLPEVTHLVSHQQMDQLPEATGDRQASSHDEEEDSDEETDTDSDSDAGSIKETGDSDPDTALTKQRIHLEANEIIRYSATGYPQAPWARTSLKKRIRDELKEEEYACAVDERASRQDELCLWAVVGQAPPSSALLAAATAFSADGNAPPQIEGFSLAARRYPVDEVIETGRNWRDKLQYEAEWEATAAETQMVARAATEQERDLL